MDLFQFEIISGDGLVIRESNDVRNELFGDFFMPYQNVFFILDTGARRATGFHYCLIARDEVFAIGKSH